VRRSLNATGRYVRQPTKDEKSQELMEEHGGCHNILHSIQTQHMALALHLQQWYICGRQQWPAAGPAAV
jgi:hypothetical protein